jgi:hypothetical protein
MLGVFLNAGRTPRHVFTETSRSKCGNTLQEGGIHITTIINRKEN